MRRSFYSIILRSARSVTRDTDVINSGFLTPFVFKLNGWIFDYKVKGKCLTWAWKFDAGPVPRWCHLLALIYYSKLYLLSCIKRPMTNHLRYFLADLIVNNPISDDNINLRWLRFSFNPLKKVSLFETLEVIQVVERIL